MHTSCKSAQSGVEPTGSLRSLKDLGSISAALIFSTHRCAQGLWALYVIHRSVPASKCWQSSNLRWTESKGAPGQIWLEGQWSCGTSPEPTSSKAIETDIYIQQMSVATSVSWKSTHMLVWQWCRLQIKLGIKGIWTSREAAYFTSR